MGQTKETKRQAHEERIAAHRALTLEQRIAKVVARGGSKSELRRLVAQKEKANAERVEKEDKKRVVGCAGGA